MEFFSYAFICMRKDNDLFLFAETGCPFFAVIRTYRTKVFDDERSVWRFGDRYHLLISIFLSGLIYDDISRDIGQSIWRFKDIFVISHAKHQSHVFMKQVLRSEFWTLCAEVAGGPLTEVRQAVDTTDDIDYDYWLRDAGLRIDGYKIVPIDRPTKAQKAFLEAMNL